MTVWFVLALMTAAAIFAVLWPLARRDRDLRSGSDVAVYRDQLDEIERDRAAGRIAEAEAAAAQVEVSRRLITAVDAQNASVVTPAAPALWRRRAVALAVLIALPLGALATYLPLGAPWLPDQPLASRIADKQNQPVQTLIAQVEAHLEQNPQDGRGWEVIAPVFLRLGRFDDAITARRNVLRLNGETAERQAALGETLTYAAHGIVTAQAKSAFERAVALDPQEPKARYFLGLAAEQDGNHAQAATIWRTMLQAAASDAPWAETVRRALARVEGRVGPSEEEVVAAAQLSAEQRATMIRGMVERLAERLNREGSDLDGWLRLVRSYVVLGEHHKALAAVADARRALADAPEKLRRLDELVKGLGLEG